ncbi:hypothetical protein AMTR_s00009p00113830 [Amborella trichopoda]|uniref:Uncharacterized protein n=1 Tax=Amborella trichopoda TaxID=13333 RepID=W1NGE7_AMBTC|nr:hypothetical protein AMTR_s00009p00113830 [Amborella trichopoda]
MKMIQDQNFSSNHSRNFSRRSKRRNFKKMIKGFRNLRTSKQWILVGRFMECLSSVVPTVIDKLESACDNVVGVVSPLNFSKGNMHGDISRLHIEAPTSGKAVVDVEIFPPLSSAASICGIAFLSSPYLFLVKEVKPTAAERKTKNFYRFLWFDAALIVKDYKHCSALALNLVLLSVANMYPLSHRRATRKLRSSPKPGFDPLMVDPLALVVLDERNVHVDLEEGEFFPKVLEKQVEATNTDGPVEPEVQFPKLALVEMDAYSPLNVVWHEDRVLLRRR